MYREFTTTALTPIPELRARLRGRVLVAGDPEYEQARGLFYGGFDRRPALIARVADAADVAHVILQARESGLPLAVCGGGHSLAGHSVVDGGIVLDLSDMKGLELDVQGRSAWAAAGLTALEYTQAAGKHGLATGFGDTGSVGISGLTLGGGMGFLVRKYGLTIDDLLAAEIVTADGQLRHIDHAMHPDLFWAIRGGGGNFGVVTRFRFRLHEVNTIVDGLLVLPSTPDVITSFVAKAEAAPEELSTITNIIPAPPLPFLPVGHHGKLVMMATLVYAGDAGAGERAIAPLRALATPLADLVRPMRYPEMYPQEEGGNHPLTVGHPLFVDTLDHRVAETIVDHLQTSSAPLPFAQLRVLGGAMARVPVEATAFAHRQRKMLLHVGAFYQHPDETALHESWAASFAALRQKESGAYVNFLGQEGEARIHEAYPRATWERLTAIKARYDPTNLFRLNQNIAPIGTRRDRHRGN